jgi:hypothetical protein
VVRYSDIITHGHRLIAQLGCLSPSQWTLEMAKVTMEEQRDACNPHPLRGSTREVACSSR